MSTMGNGITRRRFMTGPTFACVDGTLDVSTPSSGTITQNSYPMGIGYNAQGVSGQPTYFFNGAVDEVSLYHRALSSNEVTAGA